VVDDEASASEALGVLFDSCGAVTRVAESVAEALVVFDAWHPDVVVSDIAMPGEDGYSLIRRIRLRSSEQGGLTPAMALTAYAKIEDRVTILKAGSKTGLTCDGGSNTTVTTNPSAPASFNAAGSRCTGESSRLKGSR